MSNLPGEVPRFSIPRNRARPVRRIIWPAIVGILLCLLSGSGAAAQQNPKNVLVVFSFSTRGVYSGLLELKSRMQAAVPWPIDFYVDYLEGRRFGDPAYEKGITDNFRRNYQD